MQNGEDKHGKIVSTRVPLPDYVNLLEEAQERGLKLSELLILKIFSKKTGNQIEPTRSNEHEVGSLDCPKVYNEHLQREVSEDLNEFIEYELDKYCNSNYNRGYQECERKNIQELKELSLKASKAYKEGAERSKIKTVSNLTALVRTFAKESLHSDDFGSFMKDWRQLAKDLEDLTEEEEV